MDQTCDVIHQYCAKKGEKLRGPPGIIKVVPALGAENVH